MIKVLDCTLRDGGYVNDWNFGKNNIGKIISALVASDVDFIEVGFIKANSIYDENRTTQPSIADLSRFCLPSNRNNYVCMINYGECDVDSLPEKSKTSISSIRVTFKKNERFEAIRFAKKIKEKGYEVFLQPMVSLSYTEEEFIELIRLANEINPFAFYIVDSFGEMNEQDLYKYFCFSEKYLDLNICLGFHSHNNLQLSYSNCKAFAEYDTKHNLIVDSSILGMGRGAGNLNTEIFFDYLNNKFDCCYKINPIIDVIDKVVNNMSQNCSWGYSIPFYISAKNHCHPNYALYLDQKKTLTFFDIETIIKSIETEYKIKYDKDYISKIYKEYQDRRITNKDYDELKTIFRGKKVLLIAPGPSSLKLKENTNLSEYIKVSINFIPKEVETDYTFICNCKRFANLECYDSSKLIITSNIKSSSAKYIIPYFSLINEDEYVFDNAGLMAINLFEKMGACGIYLAGFDGYSCSPKIDYAYESLQLAYKTSNRHLNSLISNQLKKYNERVKIEFYTEPIYIRIE